jgi:hypothetical protein
MTDSPQISTGPRDWRVVAREQRYNLRLLGEIVGRQHATMLGYSIGKRRVPQEVLDKLSELFGERVA